MKHTELAKLGGIARSRKLTKAQRRHIARLGGLAKAKKLQLAKLQK